MNAFMEEERLAHLWPKPVRVATTAQLAQAGVTDRALAGALQRGLIFRLRKGAYVRADVWRAAASWDQDRLRLDAHMVTARGDPVYSYFSAARLHGLALWRCGAQVHVTGASTVSGTSRPHDVAGHHEPLPPGDITRLQLRGGRDVRVTSLERTIVDCARVGDFTQAVVLGDHGLRKGARLEVMWTMLDAVPGRRGSRRARCALRALDARAESAGESRTRLIIAAMDVPPPDLQCELVVDGVLYRPDFLWRELGVILEFDGDVKYFNFRPTAEVLLAERKRERHLMEVGWTFIRLDWKDLAHPEEVQRRIAAVLAAAAAERAARPRVSGGL